MGTEALTIRAVGNSAGALLPKEVMHRRKHVLRELAKRTLGIGSKKQL